MPDLTQRVGRTSAEWSGGHGLARCGWQPADADAEAHARALLAAYAVLGTLGGRRPMDAACRAALQTLVDDVMREIAAPLR